MDDLNLLLDDVILEVVADVNQAFSESGNPGFLVSPKVTTLMTSTCVAYDNSCLEWCEGACLRTISVAAGEAAWPEDIVMKVTDGDNTITIDRGLRSNEQTRFSSVFTVALPKGTFDTWFEDSIRNLLWPRYAGAIFEAPPTCGNHVVQRDFTFLKSVHDRPECLDLVYNGNFNSGIEGWSDSVAGIQWQTTSGVDGTGALVTTSRTDMNGHYAYQNLDVTCIQAGDEFAVEISYLNVDKDSGAVEDACLGAANDCPKARLQVINFDPTSQRFETSHWKDIGFTAVYDNTGVWNTITGTWIVNEEEGAADRINLNIPGGTDQLIIDKVSFKKTVVGNRRGLRISTME